MAFSEICMRTDPQAPRVSFLKDSHTLTASLKSPSMVANSANLRCCIGVFVPLEVLTDAEEFEYELAA